MSIKNQEWNEGILHSSQAAHALQTRGADLIKSENYWQLLFSCIDVTVLDLEKNQATLSQAQQEIIQIQKICPSLPPPASLCTWPENIPLLIQDPLLPETPLAVVSSVFPKGEFDLEEQINSAQSLVQQNIQELELMFPRALFLKGKHHEVVDHLKSLREICADKTIKLILETAEFQDHSQLADACSLAIECKVNFLKTSSGFSPAGGADLWRANVLLQAISKAHKELGAQIGIKLSGGIRSSEQAFSFLALVLETVGEEWLTPIRLRIGASTLISQAYHDCAELIGCPLK